MSNMLAKIAHDLPGGAHALQQMQAQAAQAEQRMFIEQSIKHFQDTREMVDHVQHPHMVAAKPVSAHGHMMVVMHNALYSAFEGWFNAMITEAEGAAQEPSTEEKAPTVEELEEPGPQLVARVAAELGEAAEQSLDRFTQDVLKPRWRQ